MSLLKNENDLFLEENDHKTQDISLNMEIKAKNSFHTFEINFQISNKTHFDEAIRPIELFDSSVNNVLAINLLLKNKDQNYYNKNNEQIEVMEFYQDIYTLEELKNNVNGLEWFTELFDFQNAFIKSILRNNYELLIIKNILLLNLNIINYFGDNIRYNLIIRPYINNKVSSQNNFLKLFYKYNTTKKDPHIKYKSLAKNDTKINNIPEPKINLLMNKKRLRKKNESIQNISTIDISNSNSNIDIEKSLSDINDTLIEDLPEFERDALAKESNIITDFNEEVLIGNAITNFQKKYRLIYRASRDGDSANKFHYMCDKHSNLIVLIKTRTGSRFGGFTSAKFGSTSHLKFDNNAFLFSLDNKKVFNIIPGQYAIYCYNNTGPCFSKGSLYVPNSFFSKCGKTRIAGGPFQFAKDFELNNGNEKFLVKELEVFQVKIEDKSY